MESTRPIRALMRGLDALTVLNLRDGATVSEVAQEIRLPRTTVYRILETLCNAGFVFRDAADERYRLTIMVRALSDGFDDEAWVTQMAKPFIQELSREIAWPVSIATLSGTTLMVRESTENTGASSPERYAAGFRMPLLSTAAGRVYLAHAAVAQRDTLIDMLARSGKEEDRPARARLELLRALADIKRQGFATTIRARRLLEEVNLSVPVMAQERVLASLGVRFTASAVPLKSGIERFLPKLRRCAAGISSLFSEQQAEARVRSSPETAA